MIPPPTEHLKTDYFFHSMLATRPLTPPQHSPFGELVLIQSCAVLTCLLQNVFLAVDLNLIA